MARVLTKIIIFWSYIKGNDYLTLKPEFKRLCHHPGMTVYLLM